MFHEQAENKNDRKWENISFVFFGGLSHVGLKFPFWGETKMKRDERHVLILQRTEMRKPTLLSKEQGMKGANLDHGIDTWSPLVQRHTHQIQRRQLFIVSLKHCHLFIFWLVFLLFNFGYFLWQLSHSSRYVNSMDSLYSLLPSSIDSIQCLHRGDECKFLQEKLNRSFTSILCVVLKKSWNQHPTKQQL